MTKIELKNFLKFWHFTEVKEYNKQMYTFEKSKDIFYIYVCRDIGFIIDFGKHDLSCYGANGYTNYCSRERSFELLEKYLKLELSDNDIMNLLQN